MITKADLINLGYDLKTTLLKGGFDFVFADRPFIVSLSKHGTAEAIDETSSVVFTTDDIAKFKVWHLNNMTKTD